MEKYKGFLLENVSYTYEEKEWDGHRNDGTGVYRTSYSVKVVDPKTGKDIIASNMTEAKLIIDRWFVGAGRKEAKKAFTKYETMKKRLAEFEKKQKEKIYAIERSIDEKAGDLRKLRDNLPPKFT